MRHSINQVTSNPSSMYVGASAQKKRITVINGFGRSQPRPGSASLEVWAVWLVELLVG